MKTSKLNRLLAGTLALVISTATLVACSDKQGSQIEETVAKAPQYTATADHTAEIEYYEKLISELQQALLNERADSYATEYEYKAAISDLEASLAALTEKLDSCVSIVPSETKAPESSAPNEDKTSPPSSEQTPEALPYLYEIKNGRVTITGYVGKDTDVTIPTTIDNLPVTSIGESAFAGTSVKKVTIPDSVTHIDWFAFTGCATLTEIIIPSSVTLIDYGALDNCPKLIVICEKGSYAELYAKSRALPTVSR